MPRIAPRRGVFTECSARRHRSSAVSSALTAGWYPRRVLTVAGVIVSIVIAIGLGIAVDAVVARIARRRREHPGL